MSDNSSQLETVSKADFDKVQERAYRFEGLAKTLEKQMEAFKGIDLEALRAKAEEADQLRKDVATKDGSKVEELISKVKTEESARYSKKIDELEQEVQSKSTLVQKLQVVQPAMLEAAKRFTSNELDLVQSLIERDLVLNEGEIRVKDKDGKVRASTKDPRNLMGVSEYFEELATKYPNIAISADKAGTMTGGQHRDAPVGKTYTYAELRAMPDHGRAVLSKMKPDEIKKTFTF